MIRHFLSPLFALVFACKDLYPVASEPHPVLLPDRVHDVAVLLVGVVSVLHPVVGVPRPLLGVVHQMSQLDRRGVGPGLT